MWISEIEWRELILACVYMFSRKLVLSLFFSFGETAWFIDEEARISTIVTEIHQKSKDNQFRIERRKPDVIRDEKKSGYNRSSATDFYGSLQLAEYLY